MTVDRFSQVTGAEYEFCLAKAMMELRKNHDLLAFEKAMGLLGLDVLPQRYYSYEGDPQTYSWSLSDALGYLSCDQYEPDKVCVLWELSESITLPSGLCFTRTISTVRVDIHYLADRKIKLNHFKHRLVASSIWANYTYIIRNRRIFLADLTSLVGFLSTPEYFPLNDSEFGKHFSFEDVAYLQDKGLIK